MSRALALALLLLVSPLWAQENESAGAGSNQDEAPLEPTSTDAAPAEPVAADAGDPFDYESSEQISEDLSVSFPVDI